MKKFHISVAIFCMILFPLQLFPETPEEYKVKDADLTIKNAEVYLDSINAALKDYRGFTDIILKDEVLEKLNKEKTPANVTIKSEDLKNLSTLIWSVQNIGFPNWVIMVRGTLLKTDYLTKKLEYDLAKSRKNLSGKELSILRQDAQSAFDRYQQFLSKTSLVD